MGDCHTTTLKTKLAAESFCLAVKRAHNFKIAFLYLQYYYAQSPPDNTKYNARTELS